MNLFNLGFRPFFILASAYASALIPVWVLYVTGNLSLKQINLPSLWHGHEMVFGFAGAVLAGFLFTASQNWTGKKGVSGLPLVFISALWVAGRITYFCMGHEWATLFLDIGFWLVLVGLLWPYLWTKKAPRNKMFLVFLSFLTLSNLVFHLGALQIIDVNPGRVLNVSIEIFVGIILLILGRILPFFTSKALGIVIEKNNSFVELGVLVIYLVFILSGLFGFSDLRAMVAGILVLMGGLRVCQWAPFKSLKFPLLFVLYSGFFWVMTAFVLEFLSLFIPYTLTYAKHAFTVGGIGVLCLGMMVRVSLGHTGRSLLVSNAMALVFVAINASAYLRVFSPMFAPESYTFYLGAAALAWTGAFVSTFIFLTPKLVSARVDNRPG